MSNLLSLSLSFPEFFNLVNILGSHFRKVFLLIKGMIYMGEVEKICLK
jgi:hypothetical protein